MRVQGIVDVRGTARWAGVVLVGALAGCATDVEPKGIVVVSLDTLRADRLGAWGSTAGLTPNLDRFAAEAVVFDQAYASANETVYSHAALFTGLRASRLAPLDSEFVLPASATTLASRLAAAGWDTAAFVAGGHLARPYGLGAGFRVYDDDASWGSLQNTVPDALAWLDTGRAADRPFFLVVHGYDTHDRYLKPTPFGFAAASAGYAGEAASLVRTVGASSTILDGRRITRMDEAQVLTLSRPRFARGHGVAAVEPDAPVLTDADLAQVAGAYDGAVLWADVWFGLLLAGLDARGLLDEVTIVVLSDHGEELGEAGVFHHRTALTDATLHVPLLVRQPGGRHGGRRVTGLVELVDVAPTLLQSAGVQVPDGLDGVSFAAALAEAPWEGRPYTLAEGALQLRSARGRAARLTAEGLTVGNPVAAALLEVAPVDGVSLRFVGDEAELPALRGALVEAAR